MKFQYDQAILKNYPAITGGIIFAQNLSNTNLLEDLWDVYQQEQQAVLHQIGDTPLSELPSIKAWRSAFRGFGVNPTKYRGAAEALLRRLTKKGDIPSINPLVDIMNMISIRYALPAAAFDAHSIPGGITVKIADGDENFTELGAESPVNPEKGEVIFVDDQNKVVARRWCWRQSAASAARADTKNAIITIEAQHEISCTDIENAITDTINLLEKFLGGEHHTAILTLDNPSFKF